MNVLRETRLGTGQTESGSLIYPDAPWELTRERPCSLSGVTLSGDRLMRLGYLDESGISANEPIAVVAGVLIDADRQWRDVESYVVELIEEFVPSQHQPGFAFSAKDLFHGTGRSAFDSRNYPRERAREALKRILGIPTKFGLPIAYGYVKKRGWLDGRGMPPRKASAMWQAEAFSLCAISIENYMRNCAPPSEIAMLHAENNTDTQKAGKDMHTLLRGRNLDETSLRRFQSLYLIGTGFIPLKRIVDVVSFQDKQDAILLQLADACAFTIRCCLQGKPNIEEFRSALTDKNSQKRFSPDDDAHTGGGYIDSDGAIH